MTKVVDIDSLLYSIANIRASSAGKRSSLDTLRELIINNSFEIDRPQGEWIRIGDDWIDGPCGARYFPIRCSVCGYSIYDDDATKFCPECGADMRGKDDE